jgi:hypothetical protein
MSSCKAAHLKSYGDLARLCGTIKRMFRIAPAAVVRD